eukprot:1190114-Prorocentrum_minimum.AAC.1
MSAAIVHAQKGGGGGSAWRGERTMRAPPRCPRGSASLRPPALGGCPSRAGLEFASWLRLGLKDKGRVQYKALEWKS